MNPQAILNMKIVVGIEKVHQLRGLLALAEDPGSGLSICLTLHKPYVTPVPGI